MKEIYYISGTGRSGSTILDMILGEKEDFYSLGELHYFPDKGFLGNQYCSCKNKVPQCSFWSIVESEWSKIRVGSMRDYLESQHRYTRTKNIFILIKNLMFPSVNFKQYIENTEKLYSMIFKVSEKKYLVDSSKAPMRIIILRKIGYKVHIIHLKRSFSAVLNSYKKASKKNLEKGIEESHGAAKTYTIILNWIGYNILTKIFSFKMSYYKIYYERLILDLKKSIYSIFPNTSDEYKNKLINRGPFKCKHMVAGNKLRMQNEIYISDKPQGVILNRLSKFDLLISKIIDFLFY